MKKRKKTSFVSKITVFFATIFVMSVVVFVTFYYINNVIDGTNIGAMSKDAESVISKRKDVVSALVCGINDNLTDTIIYVRYNPNTGKIAMLSIPRDTYVENEYCIGHKINAIYRGKNIEPLVKQVEEIIGLKIDYYLFFKADMLRDMVDEIGGVEVDVEIRMKYDDPTQNLHIDLYPGKQILNGDKAEQYVRFRSNNDYTAGYSMGDLDRTKVQQNFIKIFLKKALSVTSLPKAPALINIALKNTKTNVTLREALKYVTCLKNIDLDNIYSKTMPCIPKYINGLSYVIVDEEKIEDEIETNFKSIDNNEIENN